MTEDWIHDIKSAKRYFDGEDDFKWNRSSSEPDLSNPNSLLDRWSKRYFHEYISVDELKFYRRKKPTDLHTRSSVCLYNKDEPLIPFSSLKTEYRKRFKSPLLYLRPSLLRKRTTLKLEGQMDNETEHKANYLPYPEEEILKCRQLPTKNPEHLKLCGEFEFFPEYKTSFIEHPLTERSLKVPPKETIKTEGIFNTKNDNKLKSINLSDNNNNDHNKQNQIVLESFNKNHIRNKFDSQKCHLKLEGEMNYMPEYRSKFIQFPIEKSQSIPQLSNIKFNGTFYGIPEYRESFKFYDCYSKSAPIKKEDHISFCDNYVTVPEYKEKFKEPDKTALLKTISLKHNDNLIQPKGNFTTAIPEYDESFKDPKIKEKPERGKCKEPYLRLKGKIEFNPEYRSTYLDHPRTRPITKKSTSSIKLSSSSSLLLDTPKRKFKSTNIKLQNKQNTMNLIDNNNVHRTDQELPFTCQPEYRKAKREYLIKERPLTRKITENDGAVKIISKTYNNDSTTMNKNQNAKKILSKKYDDDMNTKRKFSTIKRTNYNNNSSRINLNNNNDNIKMDRISPQLRLNVDNIHDFEKKFHKVSPKFGRRASSIRTTINHNEVRDKTKIVECNPKYLSKDFKNHHITKYDSRKCDGKKVDNGYVVGSSSSDNPDPTATSSFIVLEEPCKKNAWMKKSWYET